MARGIPFHGANDVIGPPPGDEGTVVSLPLFRSPGGANVSCHELDDAELEEITRTGRVYLSTFCGRMFFPVFVGSEETVRAIVADTGPTFERTPDDELPPSRSAIRFNLAPAVIALASGQGAGIELEVDGPTRIKAHVVAGEVAGNVPIAMPIELETVIATVRAVRELVDADDRNAASSCGVRDQLVGLEQWLDGHGVDVDSRCYPAPTMTGHDFLDMLLDDEPIHPRKHEAPAQAGAASVVVHPDDAATTPAASGKIPGGVRDAMLNAAEIEVKQAEAHAFRHLAKYATDEALAALSAAPSAPATGENHTHTKTAPG